MIMKMINQYNELIYDVIIPKLFNEMYTLKEYKEEEEVEVELTKDPGEDGYYSVKAKPDLIADMNKKPYDQGITKSFHLDKYCFDSVPEKELFWLLLNDNRIEKVYFTGMLTNEHTNFHISYIDPESHTKRNYFPDFVIKKNESEWIIIEVKADYQIDDMTVQAKAKYAEELSSINKWKYMIVPSSEVGGKIVL
jgi:hypothetical protein